ncbi:MAG: hypothetical protein COA36_03510 [Desulfotalea sp.]|nr:MAG: hypothetical protein COA36_03510 [Desulfotalea sp.]
MCLRNDVFEKTYTEYLTNLAQLNLVERASKLQLNTSGSAVLVPLLGTEYQVSAAGIVDSAGQRASFEECIVIFKYLQLCPLDVSSDTEWVTYHSFKNAQPLLHYFAREVTTPIEHCFSRKMGVLKEVCKAFAGLVRSDNAAYDFSVEFSLLSQVPLFLRFNDADEEFPAQVTILFRESIGQYLDMESVAMLGALFSKRLIAHVIPT